MPRPPREPVRATLHRLKAVFGIPSILVIAGYVFTESLIEIVIGHLPNWTHQLAWLAIWAGIAMFAFHRWNRRVSHTLNASHLGRSGADRLETRRGLVILLGLDSQKENGSIAKLLAATPNVDYLALIGTPETRQRHVAADILEKLAPALGRNILATHVRVFEQGNNAESVADFEQDTLDAIHWMFRQGLAAHEVVVDCSDGRRAMLCGAILAAEESDVEIQYLAAQWNHMDNRPVPGTEMFKVARDRHAPIEA